MSFMLLGNPKAEYIGPLLQVNIDLNILIISVFGGFRTSQSKQSC